jgi:excisionase family DNA binding protein
VPASKKQPPQPKPRQAPSDELVSNPILLASTQPIVVVKPLLLSVTLAAQVLGIGRTMAWELIRSGELRTVRVGARRLVAMRDLEQYVAQLDEEGDDV